MATPTLSDARHLPSHDDLRSVFDAMSEGVVIQGADARVLDANPAASLILGLSPDQLTGRTSADPRWHAVHQDGSPWPGEDHPAIVALRAGQPQRDQIMGVHSPGFGRRWLKINASPIHEAPNAPPSRVVTTFVDITAQVELEARLAHSLAELTDLYDNAPCGYHALDAQGRYVRINATELAWLGCTREEVLRRLSPLDFFTNDSKATFRTHFPQLQRDGRIEGLELDLIGRNGQQRHVSLSATVIRDAQGQFVASRSVLHDISPLKAAEAERLKAVQLEVENQRIRDLLEERNELLDVMAHEVRQPLNNASAALQAAGAILSPSSLDAGLRPLTRATEVIHEVQTSIDNTLSVAALLVADGHVTRAYTDIDMFIRVVIADMPARDMPRVRVVRATTTRTALMDMSLMRLALRNLLSNALKFSPPGSPVVIHIADSDQPLALLIDVQDNGRGIPADLRPRLFDKGSRLNQNSNKKSGLGLYIVRRVMDLHGGSVSLLRSDAQGTTMRLSILQTEDEA